jgi:hypothetical protein
MDQKPIEYFKDWSNYLLVTTVAALGWVATKESVFISVSPSWVRQLCITCFALSVVCGIFTLALIPLVAEELPLVVEQRKREGKDNTSFYDVAGKFKLIGDRQLHLKCVCFPQHVLFILGVLIYAGGTIYAGWTWQDTKSSFKSDIEQFLETVAEFNKTATAIEFNTAQIKEIKNELIEIRSKQTEAETLINSLVARKDISEAKPILQSGVRAKRRPR